jgi:hypothetical protein
MLLGVHYLILPFGNEEMWEIMVNWMKKLGLFFYFKKRVIMSSAMKRKQP